MKKTFVTNMPDHIGAFYKASKCLSELDINVTRVSYNKAVDVHTLFIEAEGDQLSLDKATKTLKQIGYLTGGEESGKIVLLEFRLEDRPGSVTGVLKLISEFKFNISYISSQENGSEYQYFKMGLYVSQTDDLTEFLKQANELCQVKIIDYNHTEKIFDNGIFYDSYIDGLAKTASLNEDEREKLLVNVNLAMQTLDERGLSPYKTFDSIGRFAELLSACKGERYEPRITEHVITDKTKITLIEPDCGSNTAIIESDGQRVFVDSGYACYRDEALKTIKKIVPDFKKGEESVIVTHADVDHCGLLNEFDQVILSQNSAKSLCAETDMNEGFRESNSLHKPYINICKILTGYSPIIKEKLRPSWKEKSSDAPLEQIGFYKVGELNFEVYEGQGGHLKGEIILIDFDNRVAFTGDVFINVTGLSERQAEYNRYAPILMTSVDTDAKLCAKERAALLQRLGVGEWKIFGGHGQMKVYQTEAKK